ncbi:AraC family transcriptional regulator [Paenibacillus filicis]|uniref:AraC family transcriptional regulator n=1 Tax=Paenibacillus filicis TaxID=669464 RepID=A0ABU9DDX3_9BACL
MQIHMTTPRLELWRIEDSFANERHCHDNMYQITVPVYGSCAFDLENRSYSLESGEALIQYPNDRHSFRIGDGEGVVVIQLKNVREVWELDRPWEPVMKQRINGEELLRQHRKWSLALCSADRAEAGFIEETEAEVMSYLSRILQGNHQDGSEMRAALPVCDDPHLVRVLEYMRDCYMKPVSIEEMAGIAGMSRFHFIRSFKAQIGYAPYQYMLAIRIDVAKWRLRSTRHTVTDISLDVGFASPSQLYRAFHKFTGMSPEQYRQQGAFLS